jgi:hypothetical protein
MDFCILKEFSKESIREETAIITQGMPLFAQAPWRPEMKRFKST